jgi:hypothetical protein
VRMEMKLKKGLEVLQVLKKKHELLLWYGNYMLVSWDMVMVITCLSVGDMVITCLSVGDRWKFGTYMVSTYHWYGTVYQHDMAIRSEVSWTLCI